MTYNTRNSITDIVSGLQPNNKFLLNFMTLPYGMKPTPLKSYTITSVTIPGITVGKIPFHEMGKEYSIAGRVSYNDWEVTIRTWNYMDLRLFKKWISQIEFPAEFNVDGKKVIDKRRASEYKSKCELTLLDNESKFESESTTNESGGLLSGIKKIGSEINDFVNTNPFSGGVTSREPSTPVNNNSGDATVEKQAKIILEGVFPLSISDIQYNDGDKEFVEFTVSLNIDYWYFEGDDLDYSVTRTLVNENTGLTDNSNAFLANMFEKAKANVTSNYKVDKALNLSNILFK